MTATTCETMAPRGIGRLETLYVWYGWTVAALLAVCGDTVPGRWLWCLGHLALALPAWWLSRQSDAVRFLGACLIVPASYTTLGLFIPDLVPEPFQWRVLAWDAAVGGDRLARALAAPPAWLVAVSQVCYATFYFLPIVLGIALLRDGKRQAAHHAAECIVGGFYLSYLGYLLMPTLPPYLFVDYPAPLPRGPLVAWLDSVIYRGETLRQDCMPSGHTMMTLLTMWLAWRHDRRQLLWLLPIGSLLILATVLLRYHWFVDLLVALPFTLAAMWMFPGRART
jgi:membrane-associated phospholipid phosphatase